MPALDPDRPEPLYQQLAEVLREQIRSGQLRGRLPSVRTLQQDYGVAQGTAERALAVLRDEGLFVSVVGLGHFVAGQGEAPGQ
jgi:DNA-binding GntR family transcriptional regulator